MKDKKYIKNIAVFILMIIVLLSAGCGKNDIGNNKAAGQTAASGTVQESQAKTDGQTSVNKTPEETKRRAHDVSVMFINIGCADAALVQTDGYAYLIDTGEKSSVPALFRALALRGVKKLEAVFLTHTHGDHTGGMEALIRRFEVGSLYSAVISENKKNGENKIDNLAAALSLRHAKLTAGGKVELAPGVYFDVLGPLEFDDEHENNNSLVLKLEVNGRAFLFTGDMEFEEERTLLAAGADLSADILKVGNHGNPDAMSSKFAQAVSPEFAVISTDTEVDADSANETVKEALEGAQILITQDFECGVLITVNAEGEINISDPQAEKSAADIEILKIDKDAQTVTLKNNGSDTDISGYFLFSERGSEVFVFPEGAVFKAGQTLAISCTGGNGNFIWEEKKVWHAKKEDAGVLYDSNGNKISRKP